MIRMHRGEFQNSIHGQSYDHLKVLHAIYMLQTPQTLFQVLKDYATRPSQRVPKGALHATLAQITQKKLLLLLCLLSNSKKIFIYY